MQYRHFTDSERSEISILLRRGYSHRSIAEALARSQPSISREIRRNSAKGRYNPRSAKVKARNRRKCSKYQGMKVRERSDLEQYIVAGLKAQMTPEEISGRIKEIDTHIPSISAKGIYKWLYSAFGQQYCHLLPKQRYRPKKKKGKKTKRVMIPNRIGIEKRHAGANNRSRYGHFETDTMLSGKKTGSKAALTVIHDRKARYTRLKKIPNLKPAVNAQAIVAMGNDLRRISITNDNGIENRHHERVATLLKIKTFFCHSYASWQKGSIENTIGRIRRFIPKGSDLNDYSDEDIQRIEDWLNHTPRKCLGYRTPYEIMCANLLFVSPHPSDALEG
jgi:transposase, IS30 family